MKAKNAILTVLNLDKDIKTPFRIFVATLNNILLAPFY